MNEQIKQQETVQSIDFGYVKQIDDTHFVVLADPDVYGSGYGVCPKEEDPWCKYDVADVQAYVKSHPDKVFAEYNNLPEWLDPVRSAQKQELADLEQWFTNVYDAQVKQYTRCERLGLTYDNKYGTIEELDALAEEKAKRIGELRTLLNAKE